ncbi:MAG: YicC family protein [Paludibacteraceae bacterium]|nr:YicC family protein [Paludibacteraceae bacterium]
MLLSMTGYGKAEGIFQNKKIVVEVKSLNSKQLDLSTRIASAYRSREIELRSLLARRIERGKVDFFLTVEVDSDTADVQINETLFKAYYQKIKQLADNEGLKQPDDWCSLLLRMPDVMKTDADEVSDEEWQVVTETAGRAIDALVAFRKQEGTGLQQFFTAKLDNIEALSKEVVQYERPRIDKIRDRLEENLKALEGTVTYDANRLEQELIFYIEKLDISEEKQRLANHIRYFRETMREEAAVGKKIGFIAQEMGREINTLGSKSNQSEMQILVVKMKDELEQIKEQVLNVL